MKSTGSTFVLQNQVSSARHISKIVKKTKKEMNIMGITIIGGINMLDKLNSIFFDKEKRNIKLLRSTRSTNTWRT